MNPKTATLLLILLLSWALIGGCPAPVDGTDGLDDGLPTDSVDDGSTSTDSDNRDDTSDDGSSDDGTSDDGSSDDGTSDVTDDDSDDSGDDGGTDYTGDPAITGTYSGEVPCVDTFSTELGTTDVENQTRQVSVAFDADSLPTALVVLGYAPAGMVTPYELVAEVNQVGQSVTLDYSDDTYDATVTVTVALARYGSTDARIVLDLVHEGEDDGRTDVGTGIQVIEYELSGGVLTYSSVTSYEVTWQFPKISVNTTQQLECEGTLAAE